MANEEREPRPQSANDLTAVARELEYIASIYKDAAAAIGEANAESLDVAGIPTRDRGMGYVRGSLRFLQKAVNDLRIGTEKDTVKNAAEIAGFDSVRNPNPNAVRIMSPLL